MLLPTAQLGRTGMSITRVGFGAWAIGGGGWTYAWGPQDDDASVAAIRHAVESGVNWLDTAAVYGLGHSEEVVARALRDLPEADRPYVFTKCGLVWDPADRAIEPRQVASPASIRREVEDSLRRLRVERIDLYQVHWPPTDGTRLPEYWATMLALRDEGKIRAAGLSNHDVTALGLAEAIGHVDSLQPPFSAIHRDVAGAELGWCAAHQTGVIAYSPLQSGLLTGTMTAGRVAAMPSDDWRRRDPEFAERLPANLELAATLAEIARRRGVPVPAAAAAWTLAWPGVTGAIVGARSAAQVDGWLPAATFVLDEQDLDQVAAAITRTGAGHGPVRPTRI